MVCCQFCGERADASGLSKIQNHASTRFTVCPVNHLVFQIGLILSLLAASITSCMPFMNGATAWAVFLLFQTQKSFSALGNRTPCVNLMKKIAGMHFEIPKQNAAAVSSKPMSSAATPAAKGMAKLSAAFK